MGSDLRYCDFSSTYGYQPFNKLTSTATYGSDANGNMTTKGEGANFKNRLGSDMQFVRFKVCKIIFT